MIHRPNALATTEKLREIPQAAVEDFPYIAIESDLERYANRCSSWHWHDYFEFATVSGGDMDLSIQNRTLRIADGEGYFLNSNVLHLCRVADGSARARLQVHQFDRSLIASSTAARRYVQRIEGCAALGALHLQRENPDHRILLDALQAAFACAGDEPPGFELAIAACLMQAWQGLCRSAAPMLDASAAVSPAEGSRIKLMLACIHAHYAENLSVKMIAQAAGVCTRECFRCFQQVLGTTPTLYLMNHRVNAAARLLLETGRTITDIASSCGFSSPSYFCKVFRDILGVPPRKFRQRRGK